MQSYWSYPSAKQECTIESDRGISCATDCKVSALLGVMEAVDGGPAAQPWYSDLQNLFPTLNKPLVEDDDDDNDDDDDSDSVAYAALEHFLKGSACGCIDYPSSKTDGAANDRTLDDSSPPSAATTECSEGGVPCLEEDVLGDLGAIIGYGGDRGSFVCRVPLPPLLRMWKKDPNALRAPAYLDTQNGLGQLYKAYKKYPTHISEEEMSFVSTVYRCSQSSEHCQSSSNPFLSTEEAHYAALHLVLPDAIVVAHGEQVGLLMPLYNSSLKEYLQSLANPTMSACGASSTPFPATAWRHSSTCTEDPSNHAGPVTSQGDTFRFTTAYRPVDSIPVVSAIVFQILEAVAYLNHRLPHGKGFTGYTHNDLHLDNILLSYDGHVALCDFELVASTPATSRTIDIRRLPPSSRQSPHGLFSETADTWAFGLIIVNLLTGVDPLFTSDIVNDFSDGPLLSRWDQKTRVLDWEANIKAHVERLLLRQDSTGKRLEDARSLLELCSKCLVNREGAEPLRAVVLLEEKIFRPYRRDFTLATSTVKAWINNAQDDTHADGRAHPQFE
ncbi:hypothetical protein JKF63_02491 [Porcisia hertigi]|uniref:Protein kinase domain-containing protein n=1 Tax=Porcisia hertigi TaxID=2761500 RepID=A0A836L695_9TRYP|nr:hypothetical protein JKF63_02491 [Porcisia hertigi]